jgi:hypothetical protein
VLQGLPNAAASLDVAGRGTANCILAHRMPLTFEVTHNPPGFPGRPSHRRQAVFARLFQAVVRSGAGVEAIEDRDASRFTILPP